MARRLKEAGAASVMPAGSPIGSGQGVLNPNNIRIILEDLKGGDPAYPVIVDAGVGTASDVAIAMELGCDGVLLNTGIAGAADPLRMAHAMRLAVEAGWLAAGAGRIPRKLYATASSPTQGVIGTDVARGHELDMAKLDPVSILGPDGEIARRLPAYEHRLEQLEMATGGRRRDRAARPPGRRGGHGRGQELRLPGPRDPGGGRMTRKRSSSRPTRSRFRSSCSTRTSRSSAR